MGNHRFRLSDMIPNAWFYKLKDMGRSRNSNSSYPSKKKQPPTSSSSFSSTSSLSSSVAPPPPPPPHPLKPKQPHLSNPRKSYYITREVTTPPSYHNSPSPGTPKVSHTHFPSDPSRKSSNRRHGSRRRNRASTRPSPRLVTSSVSAGCSCRATLESVWTKPDSTPEDFPISPADSSSDIESLLPEFGSDEESMAGTISLSSSCRCRTSTDIVIDMDSNSFNKNSDGIDLASDQLQLAPIITKKESSEATKLGRSSAKFVERKAHGSLTVKVVKEQTIGAASKEQRTSPVRRLSAASPGVRLRTNSPRIASRKIQSHGRRSLSSGSSMSSRKSVSETLAVVKSSSDPHKDFRDSMVEMIVENNLRASKDLEELLACYLSLNSDVYHDLIIKVFKQIWFDLSDTWLK